MSESSPDQTPADRAIEMIPRTMAVTYGFLPLSLEGNILTVAITDAADSEGSQDIKNDLEQFMDVEVRFRECTDAAVINEGILQNYGPPEEEDLEETMKDALRDVFSPMQLVEMEKLDEEIAADVQNGKGLLNVHAYIQRLLRRWSSRG